MELDLSEVQLGDRTIHIACLRDISERQTYTEALQYQALHDDLTDLPNRALFEDRVNHAIRAGHPGRTSRWPCCSWTSTTSSWSTTRSATSTATCCSSRSPSACVGCLRDGDTVARLGGDEFGILPLGRHRPGRRRGRGLEDPAGARARRS